MQLLLDRYRSVIPGNLCNWLMKAIRMFVNETIKSNQIIFELSYLNCGY